MMDDTTKEYTNGEVTIVWQAERCTHSGNCVRGLPQVFDVKKRPWINALAASSEALIQQVDRCPSGALTWYRNDERTESTTDGSATAPGPSEAN